ncbi:MAG: hypothetical protein AAF809_14945 [Bacteroidota bacterium]
MPKAPALISCAECQANVARLISAFEAGQSTAEEAAAEIRALTGKFVDALTVSEYWGAESLESLARRLCTEPLADWATLSDENALALIQQVLDEIGDDAVWARNSEALERRYRKPSGTLSDLIFHEDVTDAARILEHLRIDTVRYQ